MQIKSMVHEAFSTRKSVTYFKLLDG